jgi:hypothetical protein
MQHCRTAASYAVPEAYQHQHPNDILSQHNIRDVCEVVCIFWYKLVDANEEEIECQAKPPERGADNCSKQRVRV